MPGLFDEVLEDRGGFLGRHDEVDVADDLLPAAQAAGGAAAEDVGVGAEDCRGWVRRREGVGEAVAGGELAAEGDAFEDLLLGFFAEAVEGGDFTGWQAASSSSTVVMPSSSWSFLTFLGPTPGRLSMATRPGGTEALRFLVVGEGAGGDEGGDLVLERFAEALEFAEAFSATSFSRGSVRRVPPSRVLRVRAALW
jgi:hypothetical protein